MGEVLVVGGGLAGLAAAFEASRRGHFVTILESSEKIGGRGTSEELKGYPTNAGPHLLNYRGPLHVLVTKCSKVALRGQRLRASQYHHRNGGKWRPLAISSKAIQNSKLPAQQKLELLKLRRVMKKAAKKTPQQSFAEWVDDQYPHLNEELSAWAELSTWLSPSDGSDLHFHSQQSQHSLWKRGSFRLEFGWAEIVGRILSALDRLGVEMHSTAKVTELICNDNGRVKKVRLENGKRIAADHVILALPRKNCEKILATMEFDQPLATTTKLEATLLELLLDGRFLCDGLMFDHGNGVTLLNQYRDDAENFHSIVSAFAKGKESPSQRLERIESTLDQTASGWRDAIKMRRKTNSITIASAIPSDKRPEVDQLSKHGILLAGDWLNSPYWLADAATDTGIRAGAMLQERPS